MTGTIEIVEGGEVDHQTLELKEKACGVRLSEVEDGKASKNEKDEAPKGIRSSIQAPFSGWLLDYIAILVSALSIVGVSLFLWHFDGKPAPSWSYSLPNILPNSLAARANHVSINSILELFSTTARMAFGYSLAKALGQLTWVWFKKTKRPLADFEVFDQAAKQGLMGSFKLIMMLKGRHFAVIGALVALGLQIFGFFIHQLVAIEQGYFPYPSNAPYPYGAPQPNSVEAQQQVDKWRNDSNANPYATVALPPSVNIARIANATVYEPTIIGQAPTYSIETIMKGYIWAALFASDSNSDWSIPSYHCETGNCTWYGYSSLGVCSRCADIGSKLQKSCTSEPALDLTSTTAGCDVILPNGFSLGGPERSRRNLMAMSTDFIPLVYGNYSDPLAVIQTIAAYDTLFVNASSQVNASECVLFPCGILYSNATSFSSVSYSSLTNAIAFGESVEEIYDNYTVKDNVSISLPKDPKIVIPNIPNLPVPKNPVLNNPTTFTISLPAYLGLKSYLTSLFNGFVVTDGQNITYHGDNKARVLVTNNADAMEGAFQNFSCTDMFNTVMYDRVACTMSALAIAMTNVIRGTDAGGLNFSSYQATGITWKPEPMVIAGWLWIIPVAALWLLSVILLVGTVWKTKRSGVSKAVGLNPLALIFLGVEENEEERTRGAWWNNDEEVKRKAKRMTVRLSLAGRKASLVQGAQNREE